MFTPLRNDGGGKMFSKYHPFFLEKGNNSRNKCKSAIYRNHPRQIC